MLIETTEVWMRRLTAALIVTLAIGSIEGCTCDNNAGSGDGGEVDGGDLDAGIPEDLFGIDLFQPDGIVITLPDGGTRICFLAYCQTKLWACGDCTDNDGDGLVDSDDPNCLGPCQNNEAGFAGNIPGQNNAPCKMDCYWDQDTGSGNDSCNWDHRCDPFEDQDPKETMPEIGCRYNPNHKVSGATVPNGQNDCTYLRDNQEALCTAFCKPLAPNGCDCFGCCENPAAPGTYVFAGSENAAGQGTCDVASLADPAKCKACTPVAGCSNPCGRCQLCFGKTAADLPADCFVTPDGGTPGADGGVVNPGQCPSGEQPCGLAGQAPCVPGFYCTTGCCQPIIS